VSVVAAYSIKGGVGKTSAVANLAWLSARDGLRTLVWDLDPQGAVTYLYRVAPRVKGGGAALVSGRRRLPAAVRPTEHDRLDLLPADFSYRYLDIDLDGERKPDRRLRRLLRDVAHDYDVVFLDCPPSASLLSDNVVNAADLLLVPVVPATLSVRTLGQLADLVQAAARGRQPEVLGFFSMVEPRRPLHRELVADLRRRRTDLAVAAIPTSALVERMGERQEPVVGYAPASRAAGAYSDLWREVRDRLPAAAAGARPTSGRGNRQGRGSQPTLPTRYT
jgi:chromosome partitioning protein